MTTANERKNTATITTLVEGDEVIIEAITGERVVLSLQELSDEIKGIALMHGLKQKLVDAAAISRNPDTGKSATTEEKMAAIREVAERLKSGEWNKRAAGGDSTSEGGLLRRALIKLADGRKTPEEIDRWLGGMGKKEQAALRAQPQIRAAIDEIRPQGKGKEGDELLATLLGGE